MERLAIIAGSGQLPVVIKSAHPEAFVASISQDCQLEADHIVAFERLGALFDALTRAGVRDVVFAGGTHRPQFDPTKLDAVTSAILPRLLPLMGQGDDALLRGVMAEFVAQGFTMRGAHEFLQEVTLEQGAVIGAALSEAQRHDASKGADHLVHLSQMDIGQGVVIEGGLCLGVETLQGTDAMLGFVGQTPEHLRRGAGVLVKMPKEAQDLRADMPTIGRHTVEMAAANGLSAIAVAAGRVIVLDQDWMRAHLEQIPFTVFAI